MLTMHGSQRLSRHSAPHASCITLRPCVPVRVRVKVQAGDDQALATFAKLANKQVLDEAARRFQKGLEAGIDEDVLVARELGASSARDLTDSQAQYKDKLKTKLQKRAEELKAEDEAREAKLSKNFVLGKEAYSCGEYVAATKLLEAAVEDVGELTQLGGEAQLWLALSYQATGREKDCVDLYKYIESNHPLPKIRRQAADLRYIIEAPKLEISPDERVQIPIIQSDTWRAKERKASFSGMRAKPSGEKQSSYWDRASWDLPPPPSFIPDKWYVRVAWVVLIIGVTFYANLQLRG